MLAGQVNSATLDRECGNYHEIDLDRIFRPVTKWCGTVRRVEEIPAFLGRAFQAIDSGRPRPAALFLPQDLMRAPCPVRPIHLTIPPEPRADRPAGRDRTGSRDPGGGGAPDHPGRRRRALVGAADAIEALARRLGAPVITTLNGKGLLDERHPLSLGHARSARARQVLPHADAMLAVGCRFTEVMTDWRRMPIPGNLIQIDLDPDQIGMNYPVAVGIVADAKAALEAIIAALPASRRRGSGWGRLCRGGALGAPCQAGVADRYAARRAARRRPRVHRRLRDRLSHAGGLAVLRPAPVLLPVELHHSGVGFPGGSRRGRGARGSAGGLASAATAASS